MTPYDTIWLSPRKTFQRVRDRDPQQRLYALPLILLSITWALEFVARNQPVLSITFLWMFLGALAIAALAIFAFFGAVLPWMVVTLGRLWGGVATHRQVANVVSLSIIPSSALLTYQLAMLVVGGVPALMNFEGAPILQLWTFGLMIVGLAICQRFSLWLAVVNLVSAQLPFFLLGIWLAR